MNNDISPFDIIGIIGFMGFYIVAKIWVYSREYSNKENKTPVIRRGAEWDYNTKENENKNK